MKKYLHLISALALLKRILMPGLKLHTLLSITHIMIFENTKARIAFESKSREG